MTGLIVHEWISKAGGSENVLDAFIETFPEADIQCLWNDAKARFKGKAIRETWLARTPLRRSKALALPFMPATWALPKRDYDWVLTSSHLFAHHVRVHNGHQLARKFSYVHTPARYLWNADLDERGSSVAVRSVAPFFRAVDKKASRSTYEFAANSNFVRSRIRKSWDREAKVIYPPVDVARIQRIDSWASVLTHEEQIILGRLPERFLLGASRFVPYKKLDLVIHAGESAGIPVVLAGSGPMLQELTELSRESSVPVTIINRPSDAMLYALYQRAMVYVFPAIEDFGIMPVEAMACGTPVIVNHVGGAQESVHPNLTGVIVEHFSGGSIINAIDQASSLSRDVVAEKSRRFSLERFRSEIREWVEQGVAK